MTEWIGQILSGWPTWLIIAVIISSSVVVVVVWFYWYLAEGSLGIWGHGPKEMPTLRRKKYGKK